MWQANIQGPDSEQHYFSIIHSTGEWHAPERTLGIKVKKIIIKKIQLLAFVLNVDITLGKINFGLLQDCLVQTPTGRDADSRGSSLLTRKSNMIITYIRSLKILQ